jgi:Flp pilus assembly pilin Flp
MGSVVSCHSMYLLSNDSGSAMVEFALVTATLGVMMILSLVALKTNAANSLVSTGNALTSYAYHR